MSGTNEMPLTVYGKARNLPICSPENRRIGESRDRSARCHDTARYTTGLPLAEILMGINSQVSERTGTKGAVYAKV